MAVVLAVKITSDPSLTRVLDAFLLRVYFGDGAGGVGQTSANCVRQPLAPGHKSPCWLICYKRRACSSRSPIRRADGSLEQMCWWRWSAHASSLLGGPAGPTAHT